MIVFCLNSLYNRINNLNIIIPNILPQCDILHINAINYPNNYSNNSIFQNSKIKVNYLNNVGSETRFLYYNNYNNTYYFPIDDDILYPVDYASTIIERMVVYNNRVVYCVHGTNPDFKKEKYIWVNRPSYPFERALPKDTQVNAAGVGTSCFHTSTVKIEMDWFLIKNISDAYVCSFLYRQGIAIYSIKRKESWLKPLNEYGSHIWGTHPHNEIDEIIKSAILNK